MNNSENVVWNDLHNGARVPINDTDLEGAPFNLNGSDPSWVEGSINKAVYDTHIIENTFDVDDAEDAEGYSLAFLTLLRYINNDMLYGYQEDARNTIPGDFMSFRGYPTSTLSHVLSVEDTYTIQEILIDGQDGATGTYSIFKYTMNSVYRMPYNIDFTTNITINGVLLNIDFVYRIEAGSTNITHYRDPSLDEEVNGTEVQYWIAVHDGIYISVDTSSLTGNLTCVITTPTVRQDPYYGIMPIINQVITETEYNPIVPSPATAIGVAPFRGNPVPNTNTLDFSTISLYLTRVEKCNELVDEEFSPRFLRNGRLYLRDIDTLQVGVKLYSDNMATIAAVRSQAEVGSYFWVSSQYYNGGQTIRKFTRYLIIDENSIVTYLNYPGTGYLGTNCWVEGL